MLPGTLILLTLISLDELDSGVKGIKKERLNVLYCNKETRPEQCHKDVPIKLKFQSRSEQIFFQNEHEQEEHKAVDVQCLVRELQVI